MNVHDLIGKPSSARVLGEYLSTLCGTGTPPAPEIKSYPDIVYFNYSALGVSFQFSPRGGYKPATSLRREQLKEDDLLLDGVDIYNSSSVKGATRSTPSAFSAYPRLPIELRLAGAVPALITISKDTTGKELVRTLGEPSRKGGGTGPSSGSIHIWCEWPQHGIMVEFGGDNARGPRAWELGGDATWKVMTIFGPKPTTSAQ